jgi:hypothetical protein
LNEYAKVFVREILSDDLIEFVGLLTPTRGDGDHRRHIDQENHEEADQNAAAAVLEDLHAGDSTFTPCGDGRGVRRREMVADNLPRCAPSFATSFNYFMHHRWTFKSKEQHARSTVRYLLTLLFWWFVGTTILKAVIVAGLDPRLAKFVPVVVVTPFNYFVLNYLVFKRRPTRRP